MIPVPRIAVRDLSVSFHVEAGQGRGTLRIDALRRVSVCASPGEIVAVVGQSGAGKSVLAHALLGLLPGNAATEGEILYDGTPQTPAQIEAHRGRHIALVPQSVGFLDPLRRAGSAVRLAARRSGLSKTEATRAQQDAFARMGLAREVAARFPFELSGGMARRVLLAMATVGAASALVADEPTPGLDAEAVKESMRLLRQLADEGRAVLLISHDISAAVSVANRVAVLLHGELVETAPAAAFYPLGDSP